MFYRPGPSGIWLPEIEKRSNSDDDSETDRRAAEYEVVSEHNPAHPATTAANAMRIVVRSAFHFMKKMVHPVGRPWTFASPFAGPSIVAVRRSLGYDLQFNWPGTC
jgi:hypothetical protein